VRCLKCDGGVFIRMMPPGQKAISADQWRDLDAFWQLRRAEILADLQAWVEYGSDRPADQAVNESQTSFMGEAMRTNNLLYTARRAGYDTAESVSELLAHNRVEFARIALTSRQQQVIHDGYDRFLAQGGSPQSSRSMERIAGAGAALAGGDDAIQAFLMSGTS